MTYEEKCAWFMGAVAVVGWTTYAVIVGGRVDGSWADTPYVATMLWTIGVCIVVGIAGGIVFGLRPGSRLRDQRDAEIYRFGEHVGNSMVVVGAVGALALALVEADHFWIANTIYLFFALSALLGSLAKIAGYRRGLPW